MFTGYGQNSGCSVLNKLKITDSRSREAAHESRRQRSREDNFSCDETKPGDFSNVTEMIWKSPPNEAEKLK